MLYQENRATGDTGSYIHHQGKLVAQFKHDKAGAATAYYHTDLLGSPLAITDSKGNSQWLEEYQPHGRRIINDANAKDYQRWYTGKSQDTETKFIYVNARYYDPQIGRFLSPDPVGFIPNNPMSFNRYAYANNNPYKFFDPDGRAVETFWDIASLSISATLFTSHPSLLNFAGLAFDAAAAAIPGIPGGIGAFRGMAVTGAGGVRGLVDTKTLRFTQDTIGSKFSDGRSVQALIDRLKSGKISPNDLPPIRTFQKGGLTFTLDNRRLFTAHQAGVKVKTVPATAAEIAKELPRKFTTRNDGRIIGIRGALE